jgi:hypothetical protein
MFWPYGAIDNNTNPFNFDVSNFINPGLYFFCVCPQNVNSPVYQNGWGNTFGGPPFPGIQSTPLWYSFINMRISTSNNIVATYLGAASPPTPSSGNSNSFGYLTFTGSSSTNGNTDNVLNFDAANVAVWGDGNIQWVFWWSKILG